MEYIGKLYARIGNSNYFDTGKTSNDYDKLEAENKSLKENLQAIAGCTKDGEEPLTKCIHGIAVKHLKK